MTMSQFSCCQLCINSSLRSNKKNWSYRIHIMFHIFHSILDSQSITCGNSGTYCVKFSPEIDKGQLTLVPLLSFQFFYIVYLGCWLKIKCHLLNKENYGLLNPILNLQTPKVKTHTNNHNKHCPIVITPTTPLMASITWYFSQNINFFFSIFNINGNLLQNFLSAIVTLLTILKTIKQKLNH